MRKDIDILLYVSSLLTSHIQLKFFLPHFLILLKIKLIFINYLFDFNEGYVTIIKKQLKNFMASSIPLPTYREIPYFKDQVEEANADSIENYHVHNGSTKQEKLQNQGMAKWSALITLISTVVSAYFVSEGILANDSMVWGYALGGLIPSVTILGFSIYVIISVRNFIDNYEKDLKDTAAQLEPALSEPLLISKLLALLIKSKKDEDWESAKKWAIPLIEEFAKTKLKVEGIEHENKEQAATAEMKKREKKFLIYFFMEVEATEIEKNHLLKKVLIESEELVNICLNVKHARESMFKILDEKGRNDLAYSLVHSGDRSSLTLLNKLGYLPSFFEYLMSKNDPWIPVKPKIVTLFVLLEKGTVTLEEFQKIGFENWPGDVFTIEGGINWDHLQEFCKILTIDQFSYLLLDNFGKPIAEKLLNAIRSLGDKEEPFFNMLLERMATQNKAEREQSKEYAIFNKLLPYAHSFDFLNKAKNRNVFTYDEWIVLLLHFSPEKDLEKLLNFWTKFCNDNSATKEFKCLMKKFERLMDDATSKKDSRAQLINMIVKKVEDGFQVNGYFKTVICKFLESNWPKGVEVNPKIYSIFNNKELDHHFDMLATQDELQHGILKALSESDQDRFVQRMFLIEDRDPAHTYLDIDEPLLQSLMIDIIVRQEAEILKAIIARITRTIPPDSGKWRKGLISVLYGLFTKLRHRVDFEDIEKDRDFSLAYAYLGAHTLKHEANTLKQKLDQIASKFN